MRGQIHEANDCHRAQILERRPGGAVFCAERYTMKFHQETLQIELKPESYVAYGVFQMADGLYVDGHPYTFDEWEHVLGVGQGGHSPETMSRINEFGVPAGEFPNFALQTATFNSDLSSEDWDRWHSQLSLDEEAALELLKEGSGPKEYSVAAGIVEAQRIARVVLGNMSLAEQNTLALARQQTALECPAINDMPTADEYRQDMGDGRRNISA